MNMTDRSFWLIILIVCLMNVLTLVTLEKANAQTETEGQPYTVQRSDNLWRLAEKYLGNGNRFSLIVEATAAKAAADASVTAIADPSLLFPGQKIWIPAATDVPVAAKPAAAPTAEDAAPATTVAVPASVALPAANEPFGQIAFSFWNDAPSRCTYEVNVVNVPACLQGAEQCQATRRILPLNNISEPALSPDGSRIAFRGWGEFQDEDNPYFGCADPHPQRFIGNTTLDGTNVIGTGGFWEDSHPDWSPDGQRLLFDTGRNDDGITRLMLIYADSSGEEELRIAGQQPSWAPDGERFAYRGCDLSGNACGIRLGLAFPVKSWEVGNNMLGVVVEDVEASHPDWSPVSDEIVYHSPKNGSWDLYIANADGSGLRRLSDDPGLEGLPAWSPDGQWIAYVSFDGVNWSLRVVSRDGSDDRLIFVYDGGVYKIPKVVDPYGSRDWLDEQISWSR